jgi:hypothetical protein
LAEKLPKETEGGGGVEEQEWPFLELYDVVWHWVIFSEQKQVHVFLAVQVFLGSS